MGLQSTTSQPPIETSSVVTAVSNLVTEQLLLKQNCQQTQLQVQEVNNKINIVCKIKCSLSSVRSLRHLPHFIVI